MSSYREAKLTSFNTCIFKSQERYIRQVTYRLSYKLLSTGRKIYGVFISKFSVFYEGDNHFLTSTQTLNMYTHPFVAFE